ncbi:hypothetical protein HYU40_03045 [Candidatus Woesearchaeota archaeon]|nr:hypothetical protein [Candidatus Woesearchaeota archaeon]
MNGAVYAYQADASSLSGGSKVGSASVAVSGSSIGLFDFWVDKDGVEYVYVKDNREQVFDDDGDSQLSGCGVGSGVYSSKKGLIAPWPRMVVDFYGCAGSFWGGPVIAREGGKSYYVWGEEVNNRNSVPDPPFVSAYVVRVAVKGGGASQLNTVGRANGISTIHEAVVKGGLGAAVVNGVVYYSYIASSSQSSGVNIATFNPANSADGVAFGSSMSGYASGSTRLVSRQSCGCCW